MVHGEKDVRVLEATTALRKAPVNLRQEDSVLFINSLSADIPPTVVSVLKKVDILKGYLFNMRKCRFYTRLTNIFLVPWLKKLKSLFLYLRRCTHIEAAAWIIDEWSVEYFHWLTDALPRLLAAQSVGTINRVVLPESYSHKGYVGASLELLGIVPYYFGDRERVRVEKLIVPSHTAPTGNYNEYIIDQVRSRFSNYSNVPSRRIYISRKKAEKRKVRNESELTAALLSAGYEVHCFEDYHFQKQVEIMSETKVLVGLHGAGLTNMLFMPRGGHVLELRNANDQHNNCFFSLTSALGHNYFYLQAPGNSVDTHNVDITVDVDSLSQVIKLMEQS